MKSIMFSVLFIALLLVSVGPEGSNCINAPGTEPNIGKRSEVKKKTKTSLQIYILVPLWPHIEGSLSITIYNNEKIQIFCCNHALFNFFFFSREKWSAIDEVCAKLHGNWTVTGRWSWKTIESQQKTSARVHSIIIFALWNSVYFSDGLFLM